MSKINLDAVDRELLQQLQRNGRATVGELAEAVSLSTSPCWRRVRQLESDGVIEGYHAHLNREAVGYGVLGFVHLTLQEHTPATMAAFEREIAAAPQVLACHNLSGRFDYQLEVLAPDLQAFSDYVRSTLRSLPGVREISTNFVLKEIKRTHVLPL
ncbi:Lrp/AsnC family transcriptional regulator [Comamonas sp. NLF-1-9]|uniref:Lrp/AsnC family transcriptional regulator n=1 Tax=Comamonas sp. NLF-1-9 TaxID=2853163 RepID=UPI001C43A3E0|nr:Lrp/AsnC family transcriptional regulator [Comamonas sp. NLF-1-9]QXL83317.1 Lrp/AsnC family transcriptional regulator [Comamonas sp. NLF-1-9]